MALLARLTLFSSLLLLTGCGHVSYLVQAGLGQLAIYNRERPLGEVIEDPRTKDEVRDRLKWVPEIKKAVESVLGVPATSNYTTYVDLKRPYVVWSITAAEPFAVKLREWSFPIVGSVPYLGFFKEAKAREWAKDYADRGYDTYVRGVTAYSTLGYLRDPLLSSMLSKNKWDLVNLIFHETAHGHIYLKGEGGFNEQAASFIGDHGELEWRKSTFGPGSAEVKAWYNERADRRRFGQLIRQLADELKRVYKESEGVGIEGRQAAKRGKFTEFQNRLQAEPWKGQGFSRFAKVLDNNAALLAVLTYEDDQDVFDLLDEKCGGNLKDSLRYLKSFAQEWDKLKTPGSTPQSVLRGRLQSGTCN